VDDVDLLHRGQPAADRRRSWTGAADEQQAADHRFLAHADPSAGRHSAIGLRRIFRYLNPFSLWTFIPNRLTFEHIVALWTSPFARAIFNSVFVAIVTVAGGLVVCTMAAFALAVIEFPGRALVFTIMIVSFLIMSYFQIFWRIYLPLSVPALISVGLIMFIFQWQAYLWPLLIAPATDLKVAAVAIAQFSSQYDVNFGVIFDGAMFVSLIPMVILVMFQQYFTTSVAATGGKE
jgi:ABC-type glycerol-3-phosphate transport system permease component